MPELPEVETVKRGLAGSILGLRIKGVEVSQPKLRKPIPRLFVNQVQTQIIQSIERRGKYLLLHLDKGYILCHLGMSGSLWVHNSNYQKNKHDHVLFFLQNDLLLRYHDPRRFGLIDYCQSPQTHPLLSELGPEPFDPAFSGDYLYEVTRKKESPIKTIIMNSKVVVGVGNIYACESLFQANIRPTRLGKKLTKKECVSLVESIQTILQQAIEAGGSTLRDFVNSQGKPGYFQQQLSVYGRHKEHCLQCTKPLQMVKISNRSSVYCARCQS